MSQKPIPAYALINARIEPIERGGRYEDPLIEALEENGLAVVTGGGTMQSESGEIAYCGIDLDLLNVDEAVSFIGDFLAEHGAPKGSKLQYEVNGEAKEAPFGFLEGLAIYLNGTDLAPEVYETCDINELYDQIEDLLGDRGEIQGFWNGPTETALYLYGYSVDEMRRLIAPFVKKYPLCEQARFVVIT